MIQMALQKNNALVTLYAGCAISTGQLSCTAHDKTIKPSERAAFLRKARKKQENKQPEGDMEFYQRVKWDLTSSTRLQASSLSFSYAWQGNKIWKRRKHVAAYFWNCRSDEEKRKVCVYNKRQKKSGRKTSGRVSCGSKWYLKPPVNAKTMSSPAHGKRFASGCYRLRKQHFGPLSRFLFVSLSYIFPFF